MVFRGARSISRICWAQAGEKKFTFISNECLPGMSSSRLLYSTQGGCLMGVCHVKTFSMRCVSFGRLAASTMVCIASPVPAAACSHSVCLMQKPCITGNEGLHTFAMAPEFAHPCQQHWPLGMPTVLHTLSPHHDSKPEISGHCGHAPWQWAPPGTSTHHQTSEICLTQRCIVTAEPSGSIE